MFCVVENCDREAVYNSGLCDPHYQRFNKYGRFETVVWGQTEHPFYFIWNDRKNRGYLCEEWQDFKSFINGVGERPSNNHKLVRPDRTKLFGPTNFRWLKYVKRKDGETNNEFQIRRRLEKELENPGTERGRQLEREFGITFQRYNDMLNAQNGLCKICNEKETTKHHKSGKVKSLAVDHCHKTGEVRGLLCQRCNRVLGKVRDNVDLLNKMKAYLNA